MLNRLLARLTQGRSLDPDQASRLADGFFDGSLDEAGMKAALLGLNAKGIAVDEVVGFAQSMRRHSVPVAPATTVTDTCGTGGDGSATFNISTAAALLVAACGVAVAKHGNRSVSSRTGSADALEALGIPIELTPEEARRRIDTFGFAFLFAPRYHPAMKRVAPVRKALGVKTIFNLLGPLTNPAKPCSQVIGAYSLEAQDTLAQAAARLGMRRAFILHGQGHDEAGFGRTRVLDVRMGRITESFLEAAEFGIQIEGDALTVTDAGQSAEKIRTALTDAGSLESRVVTLNAALALVAAGQAPDVPAAMAMTRQAVQDGRAAGKLAQLSEADPA